MEHIEELQSEIDWEKARQQDTRYSYKKYIDSHPHGQYVFQSQVQIDRLDEQAKEHARDEAADEAGNLKITTLAIKSRFADNTTAGRLFVINGKARNDYNHPRSQIRIKSNLFAKGKQMVGSETVFCGKVLTNLDLNRMAIAEIQQQLRAPNTGASNSNIDVPPGGIVPFMVVFSNLPSDLDEFTIEVVSSR